MSFWNIKKFKFAGGLGLLLALYFIPRNAWTANPLTLEVTVTVQPIPIAGPGPVGPGPTMPVGPGFPMIQGLNPVVTKVYFQIGRDVP
jgi:hypothetical protein